jgi:transcriptional regulator with XRE-family HTH domain
MAVQVGRCLLQKLLRERGLTQQDIANRLQMPRQQVSDYANNRIVMSLRTAKAIAYVLGCHIDDLYEWFISPPSKKRSSIAE